MDGKMREECPLLGTESDIGTAAAVREEEAGEGNGAQAGRGTGGAAQADGARGTAEEEAEAGEEAGRGGRAALTPEFEAEADCEERTTEEGIEGGGAEEETTETEGADDREGSGFV